MVELKPIKTISSNPEFHTTSREKKHRSARSYTNKTSTNKTELSKPNRNIPTTKLDYELSKNKLKMLKRKGGTFFSL